MTKAVTLNLNSEYFKSLRTSDKQLRKAAKAIAKELKHHFDTDGWDVNYSIVVQDVFERAYGHHLENYILKELSVKLKKFSLVTAKDGDLVIRVPKRRKNEVKRSRK